jgi:hypothetical protein
MLTEGALAGRAFAAEEAVVIQRYRNAEPVVPVLVCAVILGAVRQIKLHAPTIPDGADILGCPRSSLVERLGRSNTGEAFMLGRLIAVPDALVCRSADDDRVQ